MNKLFYGIVAVALIAMLATPVFADTIPVEAGPGNIPPEIYLLESKYDICADDQWGGSRPYMPTSEGTQDAQTDGCIVLFKEARFQQYAFTGEQIYFLVAVRDLNGAPDIGYSFFTVGDQFGDHREASCNDVTNDMECKIVSGKEVCKRIYNQGDFDSQIPEKPFTPAGFNEATDKIFECILTVEPSWYGKGTVNIQANDQAGAVTDDGISQTWFFNPAIMIDLSTNNGYSSIKFEPGLPGQTVMSTNKLVVTNLAEGGVDLWAFIAADDLTDPTHSGAKCPISNVLDVNGDGEYDGMEYRCKIGTFEDDNWHNIPNKDTSEECNRFKCLGAESLIETGPLDNYSIIKNKATAECQFRLTYPVPCIGSFIEGNFHIIVRAL